MVRFGAGLQLVIHPSIPDDGLNRNFRNARQSRACSMSTVPILIADDDRKNIVIDRPAIVVGRSRRRSDIRIDDRSISAVHCEIEIGENCLQVRNRGRNGIRINGQKRDEGVLRDGDDFEIARMKYRVLMEGDPSHPNTSKSSSNNDWFVRLAGLELGPMPWAELALMVQRGELTETDEVRWSKQRLWRPAVEADGLFGAKTKDAESPEQKYSEPEPAESLAAKTPEPTTASSTHDSDDESATVEFEFAGFGAEEEPLDSPGHDGKSLADTATDLLDETATSANTFKLSEPPIDNSEAPAPILNNDNEQTNDVAQWRLEDPSTEQEAASRVAEPSRLDSSASSLPPLPVPLALKAASAPQAIPPKSPPISIPKVGRSDSWIDIVYDNFLEPVLTRVPILQTWPGVAAVVAAVLLLFFMMGESYEGATVSGRVMLNGQPVTDATISFTDLKNGFGASAIVGPDGTFEVVTLKGGMQPGTYSVAIMPLKPESPEVVSELQRQFSESQNGNMHDEEMMMGVGEAGYQPESSSEAEEETFELPAATIPFTYRSIQTSGISKEITEEGPNELLIELVASPD